MSDTSMMDQLDEGIDAVLAGEDRERLACESAVAELLVVAASLRALPRPDFKTQLKDDLLGITTTIQRRDSVDGPVPMNMSTLGGRVLDMYPVQRRSFMASLGAHALVIAMLVTSGIWAASNLQSTPRVTSTLVTDLTYALPSAPDRTGGGGGGGDRDMSPASRGNPPRFAHEQIVPPAIVVRREQPRLSAEPTLVGPPSLTFPQTAQMGDPFSHLTGPLSNGTGNSGGIGTGDHGGVGPGKGPGVGDGRDGGIGGGPYVVGHGVSAPRLIYDPEPEYSDEARKQRYQGVVLLRVVVGNDGLPRDVRVAQSLGLGLDEKALEAVRQWRFEPGRLEGRAVDVVVNIQVNFRLY